MQLNIIIIDLNIYSQIDIFILINIPKCLESICILECLTLSKIYI